MAVSPNTHSQPASPTQAAPVELSCAELWGGNTRVDTPISTPGVSGHLLSIPSDGTRGGDVHFVTVCNSGMIARMILGDVVGHGEEVAAVGGEIHCLLRSHLNALNQSKILSKLNHRLEKGGYGNMTTVAAVTYTPWLGRLSVSYAGHPPGWLYRGATGQWERLESDHNLRDENPYTDLPLAVEPEAVYSRRDERIYTGDRLVLVTDGVLEAPLASGEMLGSEGFGAFLARNPKTPPSVLCRQLCAELGIAPDARPADDLSILVVDFNEVPRGMLFKGMWNKVTTMFNTKSQVEFGQA